MNNQVLYKVSSHIASLMCVILILLIFQSITHAASATPYDNITLKDELILYKQLLEDIHDTNNPNISSIKRESCLTQIDELEEMIRSYSTGKYAELEIRRKLEAISRHIMDEHLVNSTRHEEEEGYAKYYEMKM